MRHYVTSLPEGFCLKDNALKVAENPEINECISKPGYEDIKEHKPLKVTTIATFYDHNNQGMFKGSTDRYTGYTIVGLE